MTEIELGITPKGEITLSLDDGESVAGIVIHTVEDARALAKAILEVADQVEGSE